MKVLRKLLVIFIIPMLIIAMVPVTRAYAAEPFIYDEVGRDVHQAIDNPCGFSIDDHEFGTIRWIYFFDNAGNLTRLDGFLGQMNMTWSANGKSLDVQMTGALHLTAISDTQYLRAETGMGLLITVPGYGNVYGKVGLQVSLWDFGSPNTMVDVIKEVGTPSAENWGVICAQLAP